MTKIPSCAGVREPAFKEDAGLNREVESALLSKHLGSVLTFDVSAQESNVKHQQLRTQRFLFKLQVAHNERHPMGGFYKGIAIGRLLSSHIYY
jgi:hypothetical protein